MKVIVGMKVKYIIAICCFIGLVPLSMQAQSINQVDKQNRKQGKWVKHYSEGKVAYEAFFVDDKPVGELIRYHKNGKIRANQLYAEGTDSCYVQLFLEDSSKAAEGGYVKEKKSGLWRYYNGKGELIQSESFNQGLQHGLCTRYYANGEVLEEALWNMGVQQGVCSRYFENGNLNFEMVYAAGIPNGQVRYYHLNGSLRMEGGYKDGLRDGKWVRYAEDGKLQKLVTYRNGISDSEDKELIEETEWLNLLEKNKGTIAEPNESNVRIR